MPKPTVYLDSTIPSVYHDSRTEPERVRWRTITRDWWDGAQEQYTLCSSPLMIAEIVSGRRTERALLRLALVSGIPRLAVSEEIEATARDYVRHKLMPPDDALHLATASCHGIDILLSWNLKHLANTNKRHHLQRLNTRMSLPVPRICTPEELMRNADER
ncbi:MAG TPA: type II toxin-antitoxin system VapC family toxin [Longimicrobium sp.]|jgi:predicted nucleic acid-binding protein|uniref:type II toxin-antitoxin system VapC family toxin n=1 Tax=Longimicrobium sp. TaxID=2029185 RepID=UPI002EDA1216